MSEKARTTHHSLSDIKEEFIKYAPAYAQDEARQAIEKITELQSQGVIRNGLYYIVLVDLVGSTKYAAEHGNEKSAERVKNFISSSFRGLNDADLSNVALFVKEIGDAVLYIFQHFPDILRWRVAFDAWLRVTTSKDDQPVEIRTCVHLGEVFLEGVNPLSLAVSQCFKMEKQVGAGDIVLTDPAFHVAWPTLARAYHCFAEYGQVGLDGFRSPVTLHHLLLEDGDDLKRLVEEELD